MAFGKVLPINAEESAPLNGERSAYGLYGEPSAKVSFSHASNGEAGAPVRETFPAPRLNPLFTFNQAVLAGEYKANLHWGKTVVLGLLAGMYISIGALLALTIGGGVPGFTTPLEDGGLALYGLQKLLFSVVFPVGLLLVTLSGAELVTSSLAIVTVSLFEGTITVKQLVKNWLVSYVCNFLGCLFFVMLSLQAEIFLDATEVGNRVWTDYAVSVAYKKTHLSFQESFTRGFLCNWLVCLAVYNSGGANTIPGKAMAIWPAIMAFVAMGFEHCVANMYFIPLGLFLNDQLPNPQSDLTWGKFFLNNLLPVTFGNLVGAVTMVAFMYSLAYGRSGSRVAGFWNQRVLKVNPSA